MKRPEITTQISIVRMWDWFRDNSLLLLSEQTLSIFLLFNYSRSKAYFFLPWKWINVCASMCYIIILPPLISEKLRWSNSSNRWNIDALVRNIYIYTALIYRSRVLVRVLAKVIIFPRWRTCSTRISLRIFQIFSPLPLVLINFVSNPGSLFVPRCAEETEFINRAWIPSLTFISLSHDDSWITIRSLINTDGSNVHLWKHSDIQFRI